MKLNNGHIIEGLFVADVLFNIKEIRYHLREICEQCVYLIYRDKL